MIGTLRGWIALNNAPGSPPAGDIAAATRRTHHTVVFLPCSIAPSYGELQMDSGSAAARVGEAGVQEVRGMCERREGTVRAKTKWVYRERPQVKCRSRPEG
jgi:hypothetical protein